MTDLEVMPDEPAQTLADRALEMMPRLLEKLSRLEHIETNKRRHVAINRVETVKVIAVSTTIGNGVTLPIESVTRYYTKHGVYIGEVAG